MHKFYMKKKRSDLYTYYMYYMDLSKRTRLPRMKSNPFYNPCFMFFFHTVV